MQALRRRLAVARGDAPADLVVRGAIAPGYRADLLVLPDLETFVPDIVLKGGRPVGDVPRLRVPTWVRQTVRLGPLGRDPLRIPWRGEGRARVIGSVPGQTRTEALEGEPTVEHGEVVADPGRDLAKIAVIERHHGTGRIGLGLVRGLGLREGALAQSVAHDAHNVVVAGMSDRDMLAAVERLAALGGGLVVVAGGEVRAELALPIAGLLSDAPVGAVVDASRRCVEAARALGSTLPSPFQTLAFLALSVIPSLKITDHGLVNVDAFRLVGLRV